jgi:hypothetical protein
MTTIGTTINHGVTITSSGSYQSPLTILAAGGIINSNGSSGAAGDAIFGPAVAAYTIDNAGTVSGSYDGVDLRAGGGIGNSGSIAGGDIGVYITGGVGSVSNTGAIVSVNDANYGVLLEAGGAVANNGAGYISGGIEIKGTAGFVGNSGTIVDRIGDGVRLRLGGAVIDYGTIASAADGIELGAAGSVGIGTAGLVTASALGVYFNGVGFVTNQGKIESSGLYGIDLNQGGEVLNAATAYIRGGIEGNTAAVIVSNYGTVAGVGGDGVKMAAGGTVVNAGTISGAVYGIYLGGSGSNLLVLERGYSVSGGILGSGSASNTVELSGSVGAVTVDFNGLASSNFNIVDFAAPSNGNNETLVIGNTASLPGTIEGFTAFHDIIDLTNFTYHAGASVTETGDKLTIISGSDTLTLQLAGSYASQWHATSDGQTGTDIEPACFARGTSILTMVGERPVEELQIGDEVLTLAGDKRRIKWIGRRGYRGAFLLRNSDMWPICVTAGALGPDVPRGELYLSAKHALFLDGLLIPVGCLVNGSSIVRCDCPDEIEYFHIELETHDVIFAEGAAAETFVDCDSRGIFHNAHEFALLYPVDKAPRWRFCAPRVEAGRDLDRIRRRLNSIARASRVAA